MCEIVLTKGLVAIVDAEDYERLNQWKWHAVRGYAVHNIPNTTGKGRRLIAILMSRFILNLPDHLEADHINRNPLDNRKANLRPATRSQNSINQRKQRSKYGIRGVDLDSRYDRWFARITLNRKRQMLGRYDTHFEAAIAYDRAARRLHGEFACLNLPSWISDQDDPS